MKSIKEQREDEFTELYDRFKKAKIRLYGLQARNSWGLTMEERATVERELDEAQRVVDKLKMEILLKLNASVGREELCK